MRTALPLTRAFEGVHGSRCSARHSSNDAIGRYGFPPGGGIASSRSRRRARCKASWLHGPRPVESGAVSWPSGARGWCRSGSGPARCGDDAGGGRGAGGGADTRAVAEVFVNNVEVTRATRQGSQAVAPPVDRHVRPHRAAMRTG